MRYWYALKNAFLQREALKSHLDDKLSNIKDLSEITLDTLDKANVAILVLDFDGVLAGHDVDCPDLKTHQWLEKICSQIGELRVAILSNKPKRSRLEYFQKNFPNILWMDGVAKKPYPDGLLAIAESKDVYCDRLALVDDRLLTGVLACKIAGAQALWLTKPKVAFAKHPIKESFFMGLRLMDKLIIRFFSFF